MQSGARYYAGGKNNARIGRGGTQDKEEEEDDEEVTKICGKTGGTDAAIKKTRT